MAVSCTTREYTKTIELCTLKGDFIIYEFISQAVAIIIKRPWEKGWEINKALGEGIRKFPKGIFCRIAGKVDRTFERTV